jgi:hypothetical protein
VDRRLTTPPCGRPPANNAPVVTIPPALLVCALLLAVLAGAGCVVLGAWVYYRAANRLSPSPAAPAVEAARDALARGRAEDAEKPQPPKVHRL